MYIITEISMLSLIKLLIKRFTFENQMYNLEYGGYINV